MNINGNFDKKIYEGILKLREDIQKEKSCGVGDVNYMTNPNLEQDRVQLGLINLVVNTSTLLSNITSMTNMPCKGEFLRIDTCDIVAKGACVDCSPRVGIDDSRLPYELVKYMAEFQIPFDFLECNALGNPQQVQDQLLAMWLTQIRNNMELAAIYGDESLPTGAGQTPWNNLMGINDGLLKKACLCTPECQIIDAAGRGPSPDLFHDAQQLLPIEYRENEADYEFISGVGLKAWYAKYLADRGTEAADNALKLGSASPIWGSSFFTVPSWREQLAYATDRKVTHVLYARRSNMVHLSGREFQLESERNIKCDTTDYTSYWKTDVMWQRPEEVVLIKNLDLCGIPYEGCAQVCHKCDYDVNNPCDC